MLTLLSLKLILAKGASVIGFRFIQFAWIAVVFIPLERLIPFHPKQRLFRKLFILDLFHYFVGGIFIIVFAALTYRAMPMVFAFFGWSPARTGIATLPAWQQLLLYEIGWTGLGYWVHRLEHVWAPLWRMHAIHESTREIDWLSAFRLHPLEPAMFQVLTIVPLWFLGVSHQATVAYAIYSYITAHVQHANIVLPIGPLKYVFATPQFHRWHHARIIDENGVERPAMINFGQYPIWDLLFGTFYLPDTNPVAYGSAYGDAIPTGYAAQLAFPFGLHDLAGRWSDRFWSWFRLRDRVAKTQDVIRPHHDAWETRLARLCLVSAVAPEPEKGP